MFIKHRTAATGLKVPMNGASLKHTQLARKCAAMTLMEILVASAIGSLVLAALASLISYSAGNFASMFNYVDMDADTRYTLDLLSTEIRQADAVVSFSTNQLVLTNVAAGTLVDFTYDPLQQTLVRSSGAKSKTLLRYCDSFSFSYFRSLTMPGSYDQYPATGASDLKMVHVNWRCYRTTTGQPNTEDMQTAKILIRKQ
ncbi:MAG: prepilin-type N-terminal cleavage/methylation domain-containing protein [Verrucomicrobia bacterium]|nr:prepilin-type N-terminal cleavage/methylation domain-containing protein [Verrucomicrobiota bacterium]